MLLKRFLAFILSFVVGVKYTVPLMWLLCLSASAQTVKLAWNPSISTNVTGYKIYYGGASGVYTNTIDFGDVTNCVISNLVSRTTYYFAATAHDSDGNESIFSNEAEWPVITSSGGFLPMMW